ncbi:prolyl-tRNA synthetase, putative [Entamoeba dispar SAW760]|uniref:Proline--tRNA ligase n=1 Tax=Entamoeba dispar (strain ATCC PRA-260 / SAW760) TaxID=370354 RepID=B0ER93_ENTDS|nr:prolyl-tRNA synthetase, putative [Entamoeba dispar SAW760]EDR22941.1 prolyl-tRNA synthetase, putative [Entamoeba dispar SAW760]|eukprot:EDR22941.1 prolyl-tRNA synthetase, putative [Entamoeba dispar SAW760]
MSSEIKEVKVIQQQQKKERKPKQKAPKVDKEGTKIDTRKRLDKEGNFPEWYSQIVVQSGLIEYYDISGCYILKPSAYGIWENIQHFMDTRIKKMGVENAYFPCFVSQATLKKEEDELNGFTPEVAWVTKSGQSDLQEPIALRPTSETIIYPAFKNWISGHRDLPIKVNQWCNVVRWEFSHPYPFIRTREFLWQEGHTAFATQIEAEKECHQILELYASVYEDLLAVPVIRGKKSKGETFPGAYYSLTVECIIPTNGRSVQAATSHHLGQTFSKLFQIEFEDEDNKKQLVWQNSWGLSTRSIGVTIMTHGDNKGIIVPPRAAQKQVVIITLHHKGSPNDEMDAKAEELTQILLDNGIRAFADTNEMHKPGWKFSEYEMRGIPIRIELGPRDYEGKKVVIVRRDNGTKSESTWEDLIQNIKKTIDEMHHDMYEKALKARDAHLIKISTWNEFMDSLDKRCSCLAPWCEGEECEKSIKTRSATESIERAKSQSDKEQAILTGSAKVLCIPLKQDSLPEGAVCFQCGKKATTYGCFGRSY